MPVDLPENAEAKLLIFSSVSSNWGPESVKLRMTFAAFNWILNNFTGGSNQEANKTWLKELAGGLKLEKNVL